ncbi:hypothetical protein GC584_02510 [Corynebacterium sp. zg912]|uniref:Uncharacterized protein n=1 Tax=Corynebacterium wankanglinii TaxID=2735136 RepID=A0A7H0KAL1_9CORY|nr:MULTISPECIES: hypothetical protein [Corynebacterium]MBA1836329.1 hypothetical protein [Corynebacterium wankanglinii]MCR5928324.1 hypothetical protein [Corynebacterium sp. zg912]QNP94327.1 hypothetical protein IA203_01780 [Corynebacterium wankanglinii]
MSKQFSFAALAGASCITLAALATPPAAAAPALAAPGAPIATLFSGTTSFAHTARCSQGPAGVVRTPDGQAQRVMVTAAHCFEVKGEQVEPVVYAPVRANGGVEYPRVGAVEKQRTEFALGNGELMDFYRIIDEPDWAVVRLDPGVEASGTSTSLDQKGRGPSAPVAITGVKDYRNLGPGELISIDNAGQPICKDGMRTGRSCGVQLFRTQNFVWHFGVRYESGDSGGINYDPRTGEAIGLSIVGLGPLGNSQQVDRALEDAYGIPDGQVNQAFTPATPAERADFAPLYEDIGQFSPEAPETVDGPQPREMLDNAVMGAQADAAQLSAEAAQLPSAPNPVAAAQDLAGRADAAARGRAGEVRAAIDEYLR